MHASSAAATRTGRARASNEDAFVARDDLGIYVVADGVGGRRGGAVAARLAVEAARRFVEGELDVAFGSACDLDRLAGGAVQAAAAVVFAGTRSRAALRRMATTLSVLIVQGSRAAVGHIGDSRIYLLRRGAFQQLTHDHTVGAELLAAGAIKPAELARSPMAHVLTRCLGRAARVQPQTRLLEVKPGDSFVLSSDGALAGLSRVARPRLATDALHDVPALLVDAAVRAGARDDATAVVVRVAGARDRSFAA